MFFQTKQGNEIIESQACATRLHPERGAKRLDFREVHFSLLVGWSFPTKRENETTGSLFCATRLKPEHESRSAQRI